MSAGEAEAAQRFGQHFRAGAGEQGLQGLVGQRGTHQGADGEDGRTPLPGQQEDTAEQRAGDELGAEIAEPGDHHHHRVQVGVAMLLDQRHQALVEVLEVRPGDGHRQQQDQAQRGRYSGCPAFAPQAGLDYHADQHRQAGRDDPGFAPEAFRQRQAQGCAGGPAGQQVGDRPAGGGDQRNAEKTAERHVEHAGDHRQHRSQGADEAADQQAGDTVAFEVHLGGGDPLRMAAQAGQAADVLVEAAADPVRAEVAQHPAGVGQQQGFAEAEGAAAGDHRDAEQQHHAGEDDTDDGRAFEEGDEEDGQPQPLGVGGHPGVEAVETHCRCGS